MAIFNSKLLVYQRVNSRWFQKGHVPAQKIWGCWDCVAMEWISSPRNPDADSHGSHAGNQVLEIKHANRFLKYMVYRCI